MQIQLIQQQAHLPTLLLLLSLLACQAKQPADELARWQAQTENVTIFRDDFGVPHIYGQSDADAVFGMLYAQCEDDFNRVERNYIWAIGRLAEVEGEKELYSDLRARLFMTEEEAKAHYNQCPDWLKKLCDAFADGVNYFLHTHPEVKPRLLTRFEPWYPMYFFEGSIGGDIEQISTEAIRAFYETPDGLGMTATPPKPATKTPNEETEPTGSNGFALAGNRTESGHAMLLINPHTSFYFRPEIHVVSEEGLNVYGAVTWGQFFVYQGFNEKTGWMHTSSYADVMDEFFETVTKENGQYFYKYGEEKRPIETQEVILKYRSGDQLLERKFPVYRTHHGPITHRMEAVDSAGTPLEHWVATAMMWDPIQALTQSFTRTKLNNHAEFRKMMDIRTNSSNNTVFADAEGNIAYYHGNFIPKRDQRFDYTKPVDGSNPATDWQGLHEVDECIVVVNPPNGWLQNCNSTPFTCAAEHSPKAEDFPKYMRLPAENFRGVHAIRLLQERKGFTLDKLIETAYDPVLPGFEKLIPGLIQAFDESKKKDSSLAPAIDVLRKWDFKVSTGSVAMSLAHYYVNLYEKNGHVPEGLSQMERINYFGTGSHPEERLAIFKKALQQLVDDFGKWETTWGEINRFQRLTGDIKQPFDDAAPSLPVGMASGRWGALASFGATKHNGTKRIYGTSGNSFVAVVEFGEKVRAKSLLAGGQSGDPQSPHFYDQAQRYVDVQFKDVAFYRDDVERRAKIKYVPGRER